MSHYQYMLKVNFQKMCHQKNTFLFFWDIFLLTILDIPIIPIGSPPPNILPIVVISGLIL